MYKLVFWGAGGGTLAPLYMLRKECQIIGIVDNDKKKWGTVFEEYKVYSPEEMAEWEYDYVVIANKYGKEIRSQLVTQLGVKEEKIYDFYNEVPLFTEPRVGMLGMCAREIHRKKVDGPVAEVGVYKGVFAQYINHYFPDKTLYLFDTFEGFSSKDITKDDRERLGIDENIFEDTSIAEVLAKWSIRRNVLSKKVTSRTVLRIWTRNFLLLVWMRIYMIQFMQVYAFFILG